MRNYFLLEAGDTMYDFYTAIFDKVQEKENWQQPSFLNVQLQEAVGQRYPEDSSRYCMASLVKNQIQELILFMQFNIVITVYGVYIYNRHLIFFSIGCQFS